MEAEALAIFLIESENDVPIEYQNEQETIVVVTVMKHFIGNYVILDDE